MALERVSYICRVGRNYIQLLW